MRSKVAQRILSETPEKVKNKVRINAWWQTINKENKYLIQIYSGLYGTHEQRQEQLFIISKGFNFTQKMNKEEIIVGTRKVGKGSTFMKQITKEYYKFMEPKTIEFLVVKKFNKEGQLCYYDRITSCFDEEQTKVVGKLLTNAGLKVDIIKHTYIGIYDPTRIAELIEIYPTDEELLQKELLWKSLKK